MNVRQPPYYRVCSIRIRKIRCFPQWKTGATDRECRVTSLRKAVNRCRKLNITRPDFYHYPLKTKRFMGDHVE